MGISSIQQVSFGQEWLVGDTVFFSSDIETDVAPAIFQTEITLPDSPPVTERVRLDITATGIPGVDGNITYGGNFKPDMSRAVITGDNLSFEQTSLILAAFSVTLGAKNETDMFEFFVTPAAAIGIDSFSIDIPYVEQEVDFDQAQESFPFFNAYEGPSSPAGDNTIFVLNDDVSQYVQIKAGTVETTESVLLIENIASADRVISNTFFITPDSDPEPTSFSLSATENIFADDQIIFNSVSNSLMPVVRPRVYYFGAYYNFKANFLSTPPSIVISDIKGKTEGVIGPDNPGFSIYNGSLQSASGFVLGWWIGKGVAMSDQGATDSLGTNGFVVDAERNVTINVHKADLLSRRTTDNIFTVRNFHNKDITIRFLSTSDTSSTLFIEGFDNNSNFISKSRDISGLTVAEVVSIIPDVGDEHSEWVGKIFISSTLRLFHKAQGEWISNQSVVIPPTGEEPISYTSFPYPSGINFPLTVTIPAGTKTIAEMFDIYTLFFDAFGYKLPVERYWDDPQVAVPVEMQEFIDHEYGHLILSPQNDGQIADNINLSSELLRVYIGGNDISWDETQPIFVYALSDYDTIGLLVDQMNADMNYLNIGWAAGLNHEAVDSDALSVSFDEDVDIRPIINSFPGLDPNGAFADGAVERTTNIDNQIIFYNETYVLGSRTIQELADEITLDFAGIISATPLPNRGSLQDSEIDLPFDVTIDLISNPILNLDATFTEDDIKTYDLNAVGTLDNFLSIISLDWAAKDLNFIRHPSIDGRNDAIPLGLTSTDIPITLEGSSSTSMIPFSGLLDEIDTSTQVSEIVTLDFTIEFAEVGNTDSPTGIQVALGGFQIDGVDFFNNSPNTFFEPVFNTLFDIEFNTIEADKIYLLVKTREDEEGTLFSANVGDYSGIARFSNGSPTQILSPFISTDPVYVNAWGEVDLGGAMPVAVAVDGKSTRTDVVIDQTDILDSINVTIINRPESLDEFAFIAINRTNDSQSMDESRDGRVFGLVLDNRGAWDILVGPEAVLRTVADGEFDYAQRSYDRDFLDTDEGYDFEFFNIDSLPTDVQNAISLSPVPGYPQVWALKIEPGLKRYLGTQVANSTEDCSVDIDLFVRGRISGVEGICKVTVFYDYRCVFDVGLCDFFWNLSDPPEPSPPEIIEDNLVFTYQNLIDCQRLDVDSDGSVNQFGLPILITVDNIPTFANGNAILLIKTVYTPEIQGFYWPISSDFNFIQDGDCNFINDNVSLVQRINRPALYLPGQPNPIVDAFQISELINTEESYMYVQPRFQFPIQDIGKECGDGEFVLVGIGYQFKNWQNGFRADDVMVGANLILGGDVFAAPEMDLCYRYYYNQDEG